MKAFAESAHGLSKSPLGIIALFLVLVYAVASLVISLGQPSFFGNPFHPAVIFLAVFPVIVLFVFAFLVACHHEKLYAPHDYKDEAYFYQTTRFAREKVPHAVSSSKTGVATSDKEETIASVDVKLRLDTSYAAQVEFGFCVIHAVEVIRPRTVPMSGRYRVRVWIEAIEHRLPLSEIESVTYRVWDDFRNTTLATSDASSNFDLWLSLYGEFPILAFIKKKNGDTFELQRYLDLPGRSPD